MNQVVHDGSAATDSRVGRDLLPSAEAGLILAVSGTGLVRRLVPRGVTLRGLQPLRVLFRRGRLLRDGPALDLVEVRAVRGLRLGYMRFILERLRGIRGADRSRPRSSSAEAGEAEAVRRRFPDSPRRTLWHRL